MLGTLVLMVAHAVCPIQSESPGQIVTKMMAKYAYADSLSGKIKQTFSDGKGNVIVNTTVKYERSDKLLIEQDRKGRNGLNHRVVSDGKTFVYPPPVNSKIAPGPSDMLIEAVRGFLPGTRIPFNHEVGYLYNVAHLSIVPSIVLDVSIGFRPHLADFKIHIATLDKLQTSTYKGKPVHKITGDWRLNRSTELANGRYELLVSSEYDILKLTYTSTYSAKFEGSTVVLTTTEEADLTIDTLIDTKVFKIGK